MALLRDVRCREFEDERKARGKGFGQVTHRDENVYRASCYLAL
jgi:hypothetical protein